MSGLDDVMVANRAALVRFLRARGGGDEAEDLAQELWVRLRAGATGPVKDPLPYLYRMADNMMIDRHRAQTRRRRREEAWVHCCGSGEDVSDEPSLDRQLIARERLARVRAQLTKLGARTELVFLRFRVDGIAQREIAAEQGVSVSAVEKHLQKAYRALLCTDDEADAVSGQLRRLPQEGRGDDDS